MLFGRRPWGSEAMPSGRVVMVVEELPEQQRPLRGIDRKAQADGDEAVEADLGVVRGKGDPHAIPFWHGGVEG